MAVLIVGSGGYFTRAGHLLGALLDVNGLRGGSATARVLSGANMATRYTNTIQPDYANGTAIPQVVDGFATSVAAFQAAQSSYTQAIQKQITTTLLAMVNIDAQAATSTSPISQLLLGSTNNAIAVLVAQMALSSSTVQAPTVSAGAQTAVGTPTGNPIIVASLKNGKGITLALPFPETLTFTCTADSQGNATAGNEPVSIAGQLAVADPLSFLYPAGSGVATSQNCVDGSKNYPMAGNLLVNSDFATYTTANNPDNWTIATGVAGTTVFNGTAGGAYTTGGGALQFTGDGGGTLIGVTQLFNQPSSTVVGAGGSSFKLLQNNVYHLNGWLKCSATPAAGVAEFALVDGSGTIIQNDQGVNQSFTKALTAVSTSYVNVNGAFQLPAVPPTTIKLRIRLSTAIDSGKSLYLGRFSLAAPAQIYAGGPFISIHSGNVNLVNGLNADQWTIAIANNYATSGTGLMQLMMDRVFGMRALGLQLPNVAGGGAAVLDSLIV